MHAKKLKALILVLGLLLVVGTVKLGGEFFTVPTTCSRPSTKMNAFMLFSFLRSRCPGQSV